MDQVLLIEVIKRSLLNETSFERCLITVSALLILTDSARLVNEYAINKSKYHDTGRACFCV